MIDFFVLTSYKTYHFSCRVLKKMGSKILKFDHIKKTRKPHSPGRDIDRVLVSELRKDRCIQQKCGNVGKTMS